MRDSEFCIPTSNKAVISITPNWYDRRALDTRSNYALYSSLSHLANLCQTSPKVRESLACDGGLEQLVRILKEGKLRRLPEMFQLSKWQQALLCVVNIGVRGSESVRNRIIEADVVPVIVTILCNALQHIIKSHRPRNMCRAIIHEQPEVSALGLSAALTLSEAADTLTSTNETSHGQIRVQTRTRLTTAEDNRPAILTEMMSNDPHATHLRTSRQDRNDAALSSFPYPDNRIHHHHQHRRRSLSSTTIFESAVDGSEEVTANPVYPNLDREDSDEMVSLVDELRTNAIMDTEQRPNSPTIATSVSDINIEASQISFMSRSTTNQVAESPLETSVAVPAVHTPTRTTSTRMTTTWDQDIVLCLRLLAYLSKYPYLRMEFSKTHDVPHLRQNLKQFEAHYKHNSDGPFEQMDEDLSDSLQIPYNIFQLVEKFTMRIHAQESTYWAGVIMRNSCRRHDQGGVRQCAYSECGKWETQNREFAKCRRCRRTKYCSKACQSKAWTGHRYWCSASSSPATEAQRQSEHH